MQGYPNQSGSSEFPKIILVLLEDADVSSTFSILLLK
jgi:hypothetical protein